jgi:hypothetical protein
MGKGGSLTGNLRIEVQEALASIHARQPRPTWAAAITEIAQRKFTVRDTDSSTGLNSEAIFLGDDNRQGLTEYLDDTMAMVDEFRKWGEPWVCDADASRSEAAPGAANRATPAPGIQATEPTPRFCPIRGARPLATANDTEEGARPSKRPALAEEGSDGASEEEDEDWKATLFYWRGELKLDAKKRQLTWSGAWVGSTGDLPSDGEFASSLNAFALTASLGKRGALPTFAQNYIAWPPLTPAEGIKASFKGSYKLDQGDGGGLQSYTDKSHSFHMYIVDESVDERAHVAAQGNTQFGRFVSAGRVDPCVVTTPPPSVSYALDTHCVSYGESRRLPRSPRHGGFQRSLGGQDSDAAASTLTLVRRYPSP